VPYPFHELAPDMRMQVAELFRGWHDKFKNRPLLERYLDALEKPSSSHHRDWLAYKIGELGMTARSAAPTLIAYLEKSTEDNEGLVETLGLIGAPESRGVLEKILQMPAGYARIRAAISLDLLGFPTGEQWFSGKLQGLAEIYKEERNSWDDALKHFWKKGSGPLRETIRAVLPKVYGEDVSKWPSEFRSSDDPRKDK